MDLWIRQFIGEKNGDRLVISAEIDGGRHWNAPAVAA